jgi:hypothetical protein
VCRWRHVFLGYISKYLTDSIASSLLLRIAIFGTLRPYTQIQTSVDIICEIDRRRVQRGGQSPEIPAI